MKRAFLLGLLPLTIAGSALAQTADPHAGHAMPATPQPTSSPPADPHAGHVMPSPAPTASQGPADPHAGHTMPATEAPPDPHAGHDMASPATGADLPVGHAPAPAAPTDRAADRFHDAQAMERARGVLRLEHGGARTWKVMADQVEWRSGDGDGYHWDAEARYGGDINRLVLKSEGEGAEGGGVEAAEVQALYSRAVGRYTDLQIGVRQDLEPDSRTYLTAGFESLFPYWFEAEGAVFLSDRGDVLARLEGSYDFRLTQRLILQPQAELNFSAQDMPRDGLGSGLTNGEIGLRLRYEIRREFAPYIGVVYERRFGDTADFARAAGEDVSSTRFVVGVRGWF